MRLARAIVAEEQKTHEVFRAPIRFLCVMRPLSLKLTFRESLGKAAADGQVALFFLRLRLIVGETRHVEVKRTFAVKRTCETDRALFRVRLHLCKQLGAFLLDPSAFRTVRISPRAVATLICGVRLDAVNLAFERHLL